MTPVYTIEPQDLGLPPKFTEWRPSQYQSITTACETDKRFIALSSPTGSGKSVTAVSTAILMGGRTVILTSTKALQKQYCDDFPDICDFRGRMNYRCIKGDFSCAEGRILACRDAGCPHQSAKTDFMNSPLGVTNYSCYLSNVIHGEGMGQIDLLVLDEAHAAMGELSSALEIRLDHAKATPYYRTINADSPPFGQSVIQWRNWAGKIAPPLRNYFNTQKTQGHMKGLAELDRLLSDLGRIVTLPESWIIDESVSHETTFSPLWPTEYAESLLFCNVKKILLVSATIVPKTLDLLGIPESSRLFLTNDYTFDPNRSPVYLFGASRIDHKTSPGQYQEWLGRMDSIISRRLDRKGIIHTVSYDKQQFILSNSEFQQYMFSPRGSALAPTIRSFKEAAPPAVLISPAVTTGYDFPMSDCEYQIISKIPFIDTRPPIMAARVKADPEYASYMTAQNLTQMCGRAMRSDKDQCENFILDSHANWFTKEPRYNSEGRNTGGYRHLFPSWFQRLIRYPDGQPVPPPPLERESVA